MRTIATRGFNTRKLKRLNDDKRALLARIKLIETSIERLAKTKERCKCNLAKMESDIERLAPRLKSEEVRVVYFSEAEPSDTDPAQLF